MPFTLYALPGETAIKVPIVKLNLIGRLARPEVNGSGEEECNMYKVIRCARFAVGMWNMLASGAAIYFPTSTPDRCTYAKNVVIREVS